MSKHIMKQYFYSLVIEIDPDDSEAALDYMPLDFDYDSETYIFSGDFRLIGTEESIELELDATVEDFENSGFTVVDYYYVINNTENIQE